jgi:hypothetical protein
MITGTTDGRTTVKLKRADMNTILTLFSPRSKDKELLMPDNPAEIDILRFFAISSGKEKCGIVAAGVTANGARIVQRSVGDRGTCIYGIPLSAKITQDGDVYCVNDNYLIACFKRVDTALITEIAKQKPYYSVFRDSSFASDSAMVNFEQVFNTYSPNTIRRVL